MISVDDLFNVVRFRNALGVEIQTPNIDRLMGHGVYFDNAHAINPACNPSRASTLTGQSHFRVNVTQNRDPFFERIDPEETLSYAFMEAGYTAYGVGKLFHGGLEEGSNNPDKEAFLHAAFTDYIPSEGDVTGGSNETLFEPLGPGPLTEEAHADTNAAAWAAQFIQDNSASSDPYFLAVGLHKPHLKWNVPQAYYDLYDRADITPPPTPLGDYEDVPFFFQHVMQHVRNMHDRVLDEGIWIDAIHGYLAALSFADAQLGKMLDALDATNGWDDSTVILWSDHGYHLGDKESWTKFTHWEQSTNAPLIIADPDIAAQGGTVDTPVSLMDIFPTLIDLAGISDPGPARDGVSLRPLLEDATAGYDGAAVTVFDGSISLRTDQYRYIISLSGEEQLYDMDTDPEQIHNLAFGATDPDLLALLAALRAEAGQEATRIGMIANYVASESVGSGADDWMMVSQNLTSVAGGGGDDVYMLYRPGDVAKILEAPDAGRDRLHLYLTEAGTQHLTLPEHIEALEATGPNGALYLTGNDQSNFVISAARNDVLHLEGGADEANGWWGNDTIHGGTGADSLLGQQGNDVIFGGYDGDSIQGNAGNDTLYGDTGRDRLEGGAGHDSIQGGWGRDTIYGGSEDDLIWGGYDDDTLDGNKANDRVDGGDGDDLIRGNDGKDTLIGGAGADTLEGGDGDDKAFGGLGADLIRGETGNDSLFGDAGKDRLEGNRGFDLIFGGDGEDWLLGGRGDDRLLGGKGADTLDGNRGLDRLNGGLGDDRLNGNQGQDTLYGEQGRDTLRGHEGDDLLFGGQEADVFIMTQGGGTDRIGDFEAGIDRVDLSAFGLAGFADLVLTAVGADLSVMDAAGQVQFVMANIAASDLSEQDFLFV